MILNFELMLPSTELLKRDCFNVGFVLVSQDMRFMNDSSVITTEFADFLKMMPHIQSEEAEAQLPSSESQAMESVGDAFLEGYTDQKTDFEAFTTGNSRPNDAKRR
ncbi:hypothetical protein CAEBREN_02408 [Caenorhabditis brenneri]|uniref:Uncharacterized protein n=1 Tax=Caenorhabditis brenneri TaxID=135651 RepID=G0NV28_CAEBE|nr:hypothetical protein CAEBREN_02408 [Caenorhabditis brenneri]